MSTIVIPDHLVNKYSLPAEYQSQESTVGEAMAAFSNQYPKIIPFLYDDNGGIRRFINLFLDGEDIRNISGMESVLADNSEIVIILAVAGG